MNKLKRLKLALRELQVHRIPLEKWIKSQPGSTRRGLARGRFVLPNYVRR